MTEQSPLQQAQQTFIAAIPFGGISEESVPLSEALDRILKTAITAPMDSPPYPRSIVEGFVINSAATQSASEENPVSFNIICKVQPGDEKCPSPADGEAVEVATGSVVPGGDVAIARMWEVEVNGDSVSVKRPFPPKFFIEEQGCDVSKGSEILAAGTKLSPKDIGTLASLGINEVTVARQPKIAIFASGDEVIPHTEAFRVGAIFDCNSPMLTAAVVQNGGIPQAMGIQSDSFGGFVAKAKEALNECDMVVISGGTAVDGRDFISDLIVELGDLVVDGVPMKSGRPLIMGVSNNKPLVCVAGHPPEALRGFNLFGVAAINRLTGREVPLPQDQTS